MLEFIGKYGLQLYYDKKSSTSSSSEKVYLFADTARKILEKITDETCNQCGDRVKIIRNLSKLEKRRCRDCDDYFFIETVSWSTRSFTIIDNELERDRYYYQCPSHYGKQDKTTMFL